MTTFDLSTEELEAAAMALNMRAAFIETGGNLRAEDAIRMGEHKKLKALTQGQRELVCMLDNLRDRMQKAAVDTTISRPATNGPSPSGESARHATNAVSATATRLAGPRRF